MALNDGREADNPGSCRHRWMPTIAIMGRVIATFHTHPNPPVDESGREWGQDPSASDRRWHRRRKLRGFVVSRMFVYEIDVAGRVSVAGNRDEVLSA